MSTRERASRSGPARPIPSAYRVLLEQVAAIVGRLSMVERLRLAQVLDDSELASATEGERVLLDALERVGGAELLRRMLAALDDGRDPADAVLDRLEGER